MGDCQNYGPFLGPYYNTGPNTGPNLGDPKRDHNFANLPYGLQGLLTYLLHLPHPPSRVLYQVCQGPRLRGPISGPA